MTGSDDADALAQYRAKRSPGLTPEPFGGDGPGPHAAGVPLPEGARLYVMQKHAARNLHYDLRLELDGVLKSWAVPKDPSYDQSVKRAAFMTEDHPIEYASFEGIIPKGNYGAGEVIVWDRGAWVPLEDPHAGFAKGKLLFELRGHRMRGRWTLVKVKRGENEWLLIKERDALEGAGRDDFTHDSVLTGRSLEKLRSGDDPSAPIRAALVELGAPRRTVRAADVEVMLAETRRDAFDDARWVYELKYDGYRLIGERERERLRDRDRERLQDRDRVTLLSRNGKDMTAAFPEVTEALRLLPYDHVVIDGEVVVNDERGLPSFQRLQKRALRTRGLDIARAAAELPAMLYVFDLLAFDDFDVRPLPLVERKRLLRMLLPTMGTLRYSEHVEGTGVAFHDVACRMDLEGTIAKRATAPYRAGRSRDWLKIRVERTDDFVIVGLKASSSPGETYGSLHIAQYDETGALMYAGSCGTGLTPKHVKQLLQRVTPADEPAVLVPTGGGGRWRGRARGPQGDDLWVKPEHVVEVRYLEWTDAGQLRHPVFLRFRDDKRPEECIRAADMDHDAGNDIDIEAAAVADAVAAADAVAVADAVAAADVAAAAGVNAVSAEDDSAAGDSAIRNSAVENSAVRNSAVTPSAVREVRFTNLDKVLWPEDGYTKGDLIAYYRAIAPWMLPYLKDRPVVQTRFPDGIHGKSFFQKDAPTWAPEWLRTETVWSGGSERELRYFIADDVHSLEYLANSASIPLHIWSSRIDALDRPDWCSLDLDPKDAPFSDVIAVAKTVHALCDDIGLPNYVKTSGSSGLHVLIPLGGVCTHDQAKLLGELLAREVVKQQPEIATIERVVERRAGRVYVDFLQNGHGKLLVAPFCVRPRPGAPVSMPLRWSEVKRGLEIGAHTIVTAPERLARMKADPMAGVLTDVPDLVGALAALHAQQ